MKKIALAVALASISVAAHATMDWVLDNTNNQVIRFVAETGEYRGTFGRGVIDAAGFPRGICQSPVDGRVFISIQNGASSSVKIFDPYTGAYGGVYASGFMAAPGSIAIATDGKMYVTDLSTQRIYIFDTATGAYGGVIGAGFGINKAVLNGDTLICTTSTQILKFDRLTGALTGILSGFGQSPSAVGVISPTQYAFTGPGSPQPGILRFEATAGTYQGSLATNWFATITDFETMANGDMLVLANSLNSIPLIARFVASTGQYKGLLGVGFPIGSSQDMAIEQPCSVSGNLIFQDYVGANRNLFVDVVDPVSGITLDSVTIPNSNTGPFTFKTVYRGTLDLYFNGSHWLRKKVGSVVIGASGATGVNVSLVNGNCVYDSVIDLSDYTALVTAFNAVPASGNWNPEADVNGDNIVDLTDYTVVAVNFNALGDGP